MISPRIVALPPVFFNIGFPHDLQLMSLVEWEKMTCFSWQLVHCTDKEVTFWFWNQNIFFFHFISPY